MKGLPQLMNMEPALDLPSLYFHLPSAYGLLTTVYGALIEPWR